MMGGMCFEFPASSALATLRGDVGTVRMACVMGNVNEALAEIPASLDHQSLG